MDEKTEIPAGQKIVLETLEPTLALMVPDDSDKKKVAKKEETKVPADAGESDASDALESLRSLAPKAVSVLGELLENEGLKPALRIRICEIILERTYGKPEASIKLTSVAQTVEQSREYVLTIVESMRASRRLQDGE